MNKTYGIYNQDNMHVGQIQFDGITRLIYLNGTEEPYRTANVYGHSEDVVKDEARSFIEGIIKEDVTLKLI